MTPAVGVVDREAPAAPPSAPSTANLQVAVVRNLRHFGALADEWNDLVERTTSPVFLRHEFLQLWLNVFGGDAEPRILLGREADGRLAAALPLLRVRGRLYGVPMRELTASANVHSCLFDLLAVDPDRAAAAFFAHLARDDDWDLIRLRDLPENGNGSRLLGAATAAGLPAGLWRSHRSHFLELPASEAELDRRLSGQLRSLVRRRGRQLSVAGAWTFELLQRGDILAALADCLELELAGWKGKQGTACLQDYQALGFYRQLADLASRKDWLALYLLRLEGRLVAFQYGLTDRGAYHLLKLAYDEQFGRLSPGLVLHDLVVRDCQRRGLVRCDLLGGDEPWKRRWSNDAVDYHWLFVFRDNAVGRLLHRAKFEWAPIARSWLRRSDDETP